jgi:hypothetical protein
MSEELSLPLSKLYDRLWPNADICALIAEAAYGAARISFASTERLCHHHSTSLKTKRRWR